jgi:SOS response regulatory protein OraA/RecX
MAEEESLRLQNCFRASGTVTLTLSDGAIIQLAPDAVPTDLPDVGQPIPPGLLVQLRAAAERKAVARKLFQILDRRLYSVAVLREKLRAEGFSRGGITAVLNEFADKGLHSDGQYAEAFCRDTLKRIPVGRRYLLSKLTAQGVAEDVAKVTVEKILSSEREFELAMEAGRRRWAREAHPIGAAQEAKVVRFLKGRGFLPALARRAARTTAPPKEDED